MAKSISGLDTTSPDAPFDLEVQPSRSGTTIVTVAGEVDLVTAPALRDALLDPVLCPGPKVTVDLRSVTFCDAAGLGALVAGRNLIENNGGHVTLVCAPGAVTTVLRATGLDEVFDLVLTGAVG